MSSPQFSSRVGLGIASILDSPIPTSTIFTTKRREYEKNLLKLKALLDSFALRVLQSLPFTAQDSSNSLEFQKNLGETQRNLGATISKLEEKKTIFKAKPEAIQEINTQINGYLKKLSDFAPRLDKFQEEGDNKTALKTNFGELKSAWETARSEKKAITEKISRDIKKLEDKVKLFQSFPRPEATQEKGVALRLRSVIPSDFFAEIMDKADQKELSRHQHYTDLKAEWNTSELKQFETSSLAERIEIKLSVMPEIFTLGTEISAHAKAVEALTRNLDKLDITAISKGFVPETKKRELKESYALLEQQKEALKKSDELKKTTEQLEKAKTQLYSKVTDAVEKIKSSIVPEYTKSTDWAPSFIESNQDFKGSLEDTFADLHRADIAQRKKLGDLIVKQWNDISLRFYQINRQLALVSMFQEINYAHCKLFLDYEEMLGTLRFTRKEEAALETHQTEFSTQKAKFEELSASIKDVIEKTHTAVFSEPKDSFTDNLQGLSEETFEGELKSVQLVWISEGEMKAITGQFQTDKKHLDVQEKHQRDLALAAVNRTTPTTFNKSTPVTFNGILPMICAHVVEEFHLRQAALQAVAAHLDREGKKIPVADIRPFYPTKKGMHAREAIESGLNSTVTGFGVVARKIGASVAVSTPLETRVVSPFDSQQLEQS